MIQEECMQLDRSTMPMGPGIVDLPAPGVKPSKEQVTILECECDETIQAEAYGHWQVPETNVLQSHQNGSTLHTLHRTAERMYEH